MANELPGTAASTCSLVLMAGPFWQRRITDAGRAALTRRAEE